MIYDGRKASQIIREELREYVTTLTYEPTLAVLAVPIHPSIISFITIKRKFAEAIGVKIEEYDFKETDTEDVMIEKIEELSKRSDTPGIIVQLPLPKNWDSKRVLNALPEKLDVDVLGDNAFGAFLQHGLPVPPVALAVAHILEDTHTDITDKKVVIIGQGQLVGLPVSLWFSHHGVTPTIVTIDTDDTTRMKLYKEADIIISGIGKPSSLKPEHCKEGVILIDAGTSEQAGVLTGDADPLCVEVASIFTPVPGGVGPLTVASLFKNLLKK